ncbi:S-adenosyl-L-methionine-dependent methyltransferase superfamily protein [Babesia gibsoni]|uniref:S-adenosyl-L-methionine-dependent methyltransferase superfamily protein n=1 Tax=Babesia gibsoni TaxID=33632 RepID=A0AAD8LM29_BABGI|nr:S-adenosyl-L-methionine-dependent methyltransferase superfamily protein [Babesia gibsoni]
MNRVKNSLFSSLQHMGLFSYGFECKVIDLFCGSGSVGLEALSYGAAHCTFVDLSLQCCKVCYHLNTSLLQQATARNAEHCNFEDKVRIVRADAMESLTSPWLHAITEKFDLLFACPPYEEVVYTDLMKQIANTTILKENSVVVVEYPKEIEYLPWSIEGGKLLGYRNRKYGRTVLAIYCYKPTGSLLASCEKAKREFVPTTYSRKRLMIEGYIPKPSQDQPLYC